MNGNSNNSKRRSASNSKTLTANEDRYGPKPSDWGSRLWPIWREWAAMGKFLKDERSLDEALRYLISHKFIGCFPDHDPSEEAAFAQEIRGVFTAEEMRPYFKKLTRTRQPADLARVHKARRLLLDE